MHNQQKANDNFLKVVNLREFHLLYLFHIQNIQIND